MTHRWDLAFLQGAKNLRLAANMVGRPSPYFARPPLPSESALRVAALAIEQKSRRTPPAHTCQQRLVLSFYFDGPGHQLQSGTEAGSLTQSNVARLFLARQADSSVDGIYSYYLPGLGARFPAIGDRGAVGVTDYLKQGEARLQWALSKVGERRAGATHLCGIDVYLFGYSRGAALARAFANRLAGLGTAHPEGVLLSGTADTLLEVRFMGLWDTVAAFGPDVNLENERRLGLVARGRSTRDVALTSNVPDAFEPPEQMLKWPETHPGWAGEIGIPRHVKSGIHLIAGHENRHSLPVDTTLHGNDQPSAFYAQEFVYPGRQVDIGGGYERGSAEDQRNPGQILATLALRVMHERARSAGAPIHDLDSTQLSPQVRLLFAAARESDSVPHQRAANDHAEMRTLWTAYVTEVETLYLPESADHALAGAQRATATNTLGSWLAAYAAHYYVWWFRMLSQASPAVRIAPITSGHVLPHYDLLYDTLANSYLASSRFNPNDVPNSFLACYVGLPAEESNGGVTLPTDPRVAYVGGQELTAFAISSVARLPDCGFARPGFNRGLVAGEAFPHSMGSRGGVPYSLTEARPVKVPASELSGGFDFRNEAESLLHRDTYASRSLILNDQVIPIDYAVPPTRARLQTSNRMLSVSEIAKSLAATPTFLRRHISRVTIVPYHDVDDVAAVAEHGYGINNMIVYPTLNEVGSADIYWLLIHEATHFAARKAWGNFQSVAWREAMHADANSPTGYAASGASEDVAEFAVLFVAALYTPCERVLNASYPARYNEFRKLAEQLGFKRDSSHSVWAND